jgi:CRISPR-associated protein Cas2
MILLVLERAPVSLRGELSRWLMELKPGVFLGAVSALVRDELWDLCRTRAGRRGGCVLIHPAQTEQGFTIRTFGKVTRVPVEFEGLWLLRRPNGEDESGHCAVGEENSE